MPLVTSTFICPVDTGPRATPTPVCPHSPNLPHPFYGIGCSVSALIMDTVCGKEVFPVPSRIPSPLAGAQLGIWVKGAGAGEHSRNWCGWREQAAPLLPPPFQVSPAPSSHLFLVIIPCVLSVHLGEEEEEEKGQAARGDQW